MIFLFLMMIGNWAVLIYQKYMSLHGKNHLHVLPVEQKSIAARYKSPVYICSK